ncbi:Hypothetical predicted protein [Olea europaea subsp. europaea]|uniref:Ubiquitin-like protease family profile domain-containing protein n=1 Tax=Olea europaea subsp. europaea TaxID=158383 RepID=A0A8S0QXM1_OLEEU|nr:Hypothetical predicted protein [Olea europaea subsp. europaea]
MKFGEKVVEVTTAIEAETGIEEENVKTIDIYDDVIPNMHVKRQKKPVALLQSPRVNEYDSTSRTKKSIVKDIFTFPDGVSPTMARYIDAFEAQYKKGLIRKNNGDCGMYVKYFINEKLNDMPKTFNISHIRRNLAAQLYAYGKQKQDGDYDVDNEWMSKETD